MQTDRQAGKMLVSKPTGLSVQHAIDDVRSRASAKLKHAEAIAEGLQSLDAALQVFSEDRSSSEMQSLVDAARQLSELLETAVAE